MRRRFEVCRRVGRIGQTPRARPRAPLHRAEWLLCAGTGCRIGRMIRAAEAVLADALNLDPCARAEIAAELIASLDGPADPDADAAWEAEVTRRIAALDAGAMPVEAWDMVKQRIESQLLGR